MKKQFITIMIMPISSFFALSQQNVGIGTTSPLATLDVIRGIADSGTAMFRGTNYKSYFNYSGTEDTYIRGGKPGSHVVLNDLPGLGNVGIGTNSPYFKLTVQTPPDSWGVIHTNTTGTMAVGTWLGNYGGINGGWFGTYSDHPLMFSTNNAGPQMTILQNGNVGINNIYPSAKLDVVKNPADFGTAAFRGTVYGSYFNYYSTEDTYINGGKYGSTVYINSSSASLGNVAIGVGIGVPEDKLSVYTPGNNYGVTHSDGTITVGSWVGQGAGWYGTKTNHPLHFFTNGGNPKMTIETNGQVSINGAPSPFYAGLTVNGSIAFKNEFFPNLGEWSLHCGPDMGIYHNDHLAALMDEDGDWLGTSDRNVKEDILPYRSALEDLKRVTVSTFHYKWLPGSERSFGFIAQDVAKYFPEIVSEVKTRDGQKLMGIAYGKTGVLAIKAIQEQQVIIETLQKQVEVLMKEVTELKKKSLQQ